MEVEERRSTKRESWNQTSRDRKTTVQILILSGVTLDAVYYLCKVTRPCSYSPSLFAALQQLTAFIIVCMVSRLCVPDCPVKALAHVCIKRQLICLCLFPQRQLLLNSLQTLEICVGLGWSVC